MASESHVIVTLDTIYTLLQDVKTGQTEMASTIQSLERNVNDHEGRIRMVEARTDESRRLDELERDQRGCNEGRVSASERIGGLETSLRLLRDDLNSRRMPPAALWALGLSALSILVSTMLAMSK